MSEQFIHQKEEYLSLRKEIENALTELATLERNCLLAIAAVYVWLVAQTSIPRIDGTIGWAIPILLAGFGALRCYSVNRHLGVMGSYLRGIEEINKPGGANLVGWDTFFKQKGSGVQTKIRIWFWGALFCFTLLVWIIKLLFFLKIV